MPKIILVMLTDIPEYLSQALAKNLTATFQRPVEIRKSTDAIKGAYVAARGQYSSPRFLSRLRRVRRNPGDKVLGIVDVDIYSPGFDFVFGEAEIATGVATVSTFRLRPENYGSPPDRAVFEERVIKEAVHELGHLFNLGHCRNPACVMSFSTSLGAVDRKGKEFCSRCRKKLDISLKAENCENYKSRR